MHATLSRAVTLSALLLGGCVVEQAPPPAVGTSSAGGSGASADAEPTGPAALTQTPGGLRYDDPRSWLCLPGRQDACSGNLDMTDLRADGSRVVERDETVPGADQVDCFYVYPTVDMSLTPGNHSDFGDLRPMTAETVSQAARLRSVCRLFVPLYRQSTIGAYLAGPQVRGPYRETAARDVIAAFQQYMAQYNQGRKVVILGHSQGGEMAVVLLRRVFDADPAMREKLLLGVPVGWALFTATGKTTGGTFQNLPVCAHPGEIGCLLSWRTVDGRTPPPAGNAAPVPGYASVCTAPSQVAHGTSVLSRSVFGVPGAYGMPPWVPPTYDVSSIKTPFVVVRGAYDAQCIGAPGGGQYLSVSPHPGGPASPIDLNQPGLHGPLGFHVIDVELEAGDLVDLIGERVRHVTGR